MTTFGPDAREFLQSHIDDHGFLSWLGVEVDAVNPGYVVMRVPYSDDLTNPRPPTRSGWVTPSTSRK